MKRSDVKNEVGIRIFHMFFILRLRVKQIKPPNSEAVTSLRN